MQKKLQKCSQNSEGNISPGFQGCWLLALGFYGISVDDCFCKKIAILVITILIEFLHNCFLLTFCKNIALSSLLATSFISASVNTHLKIEAYQ